MFYSDRLNIFQFITKLLNVQCVTYIKIRNKHLKNKINYIISQENEITKKKNKCFKEMKYQNSNN